MEAEYWQKGFVLIGIWTVILLIPCIASAMIGTKLIDHIGRWPTKSAAIQRSSMIKLVVVEVISFGLLYGFLQYFRT